MDYQDKSMQVLPVEWDPLSISDREEGGDASMLLAARKREIHNILRSYTGYYDLFSELIQNALDAVQHRASGMSGSSSYRGKLWIEIDIATGTVSITDNGCGMTVREFREFVRPNFSYKAPKLRSRGCKGVGATYLAYGFNYLLASTRQQSGNRMALLQNGRNWLDDNTGTVMTPRFVSLTGERPSDKFSGVDSGTSITVKLSGANIRPKSLQYNGAQTAKQWLYILKIATPLGGIYLCGDPQPLVDVEVSVIDASGNTTTCLEKSPAYVFPHLVIDGCFDVRDYMAELVRRQKKNMDVTRPIPKYQKGKGIWGEWTGEDIIERREGCPINAQLKPEEKDLVRELGIKVYAFLTYSTNVWDALNDWQGLRGRLRLLRGGLQLATRHMPQGSLLTIPLTSNIGFQHLAHVIVHFENAEPDLGRKGFQPEHTKIAEKLAAAAVVALKAKNSILRKPKGEPEVFPGFRLESWIENQKKRETDQPLVIKGAGLFVPTKELPILCQPAVEQDVVALFNQMLSAGVVRGLKILATSQNQQYDGLFRTVLEADKKIYVYTDENPLGVAPSEIESYNDDERVNSDSAQSFQPRVLEYKYSVDGLIEEFETQMKRVDDTLPPAQVDRVRRYLVVA